MSDGITYSNKDVLFKVLCETYKEKSFSALGLDLPRIKEVLPTNLPKISAGEKQIDNLLLLEDGSYVIVDYESVYKPENKIKYLNYVTRVLERYFPKGTVTGKTGIQLRLIIIYTGEVENAVPNLEVNCLTLRTESIFLNKIDGDMEFIKFKSKVENNYPLSNDEVMRAIILPLTQRGIEKKQEMLEQVVETAMEIQDEKLQLMIMSSVLVASDKFISEEYSMRIRRYLNMTKIEKIFEKEKLEYANEILSEYQRESSIKTAKILLNEGVDIIPIMKVTGLSEREIMNLQEKSATA
jgi:hypothetical protein